MNPQGTVTPGWKTSEFWLHVASFLPTIAAVALGASNPVTLGIAAAYSLSSAIYTACRSQVKATALTAGAQAAADAIKKAQADAEAPKA